MHGFLLMGRAVVKAAAFIHPVADALAAYKRADAYPVSSKWGLGCSAGDLLVGGGVVQGAESEEGLECRHWCAAAVVTEDVLIEIDLEVLVRDAAVRAVHPGLKVGGRAVCSRE